MLAEAMTDAGARFEDLDRIGVTVGPGSFTGLRVGLAFAKGLAIARGIPCVGVGTLAALAASVQGPGAVIAAVDAKREQVYLQVFDGSPGGRGPEALLVVDIRLFDASPDLTLVGSGAPMLRPAFPHARLVPLAAPDPVAIARLAAAADPPQAPPAPIYLRAPDARLPA